jgi:arylsulfatase A-like enzyme
MQDKGPAMYDDTYHIPLLASMPGGLAGTSDDHMVSLIDLPPTFLDLAGAPVPDYFDGRSLVPLLQGEHVADWREYIIAEFHGHHFPYPQRMIRTHTHKLVVNPPDIDELYDLVADPNELANQIDNPAYADVKRELFVALYRELRASGDNFYHWMTTMYDVGEEVGDASLSHVAH